MNKKKYLTSPIFYANSTPHIGHLYTGLICDLWKQANEVVGDKVFFGSGMDEHGQKVFQSAQTNGIETQEYVDKISTYFQKFFAKYNVRYDEWVRTTSKQHAQTAQHLWRQLNEKGYLYKNTYHGWYSISDESYLDVPKDYVSTSSNIVWREEECYYFKLSAFQEKLLFYYEKNLSAVYPKSRYNETIGFIKQGLKDFSISRPKERLPWGVTVPGDEEQVMYVWIDALSSYLTMARYPNENYTECWPAMHVIGKDILKFHTIYWPALLMAADLKLPEKVVVHGWWLNGDQKVSKSLNNAIDIEGLTNQYGGDSVRYFLLSNMTLGEDANFKESLFFSSVNSVLSNKFGNLFSRLLGVAKSQEIKTIAAHELDRELKTVVATVQESVKTFANDVTYYDEYLKLFTTSLDVLNNYVNEQAIWKQEKEQMEKTLSGLFYAFKIISISFSPLLPEASQKLATYFNHNLVLAEALEHKAIVLKENEMLFPRIEM